MEQRPSWKTNSRSADEEISRLSWSRQVHYCVHNNLLLVPILSQINPVHALISCFFKIHSSVILPSTPRSSKWSLIFKFPDQNFVCMSHLSHTCNILLPSHPPWFDHNIWWRGQIINLLLSNILHPSVTSALSPNIFLSTMFSNTLNLCFLVDTLVAYW